MSSNFQGYKDLVDEHLLEASSKLSERKNVALHLDPLRFDLVIKIAFLEAFDNGRSKGSLEEEIYISHIDLFTNGSFVELGGHKESAKNYVDSFLCLYANIKSNGFDNNRSVVPLSASGTILNGSHRAAIAIHLGLRVDCVVLDIPAPVYDYSYFRSKGLHFTHLDFVISKYIELTDDCYICFKWPACRVSPKEINDMLGSVLYRKKITLDYMGAKSLLGVLYKGESWIGIEGQSDTGIDSKIVSCFAEFNSLEVFVFRGKSLGDVLLLKEKIRNRLDLGKHSIHITDNKIEAIEAAEFVFNDNTIHFSNSADPRYWPSLVEDLKRISTTLSEIGVDRRSLVFDSGSVLAAYGLRKNADVDVISEVDLSVVNSIDCHDSELDYHNVPKSRLLFDPNFYFYFMGFKFCSLKQVYGMKKARGSSKDIHDCIVIEKVLSPGLRRRIFMETKVNFLYRAAKVRTKFILAGISLTKSLGVYNFTRLIWHKYRERK